MNMVDQEATAMVVTNAMVLTVTIARASDTMTTTVMVHTVIVRVAMMTIATVHTVIARATMMTTAMVLIAIVRVATMTTATAHTVIARAATMITAMVHIAIARVATATLAMALTATDMVQEAAATEEILITLEADQALTAAQEITTTMDIKDTAAAHTDAPKPTVATPMDAPKPTVAAHMDAPKPMVVADHTVAAPTEDNPMRIHGPILIMVAVSRDPTTSRATPAEANLVPPLATVGEQ